MVTELIKAWSVLLLLTGSVLAAEYQTYRGTCDASAGFYAGQDRFVVADDENNIIRVYKLEQYDQPEALLTNIADLLTANGNTKEADLEASAVIGQRVYWIGSHGRNKNGKLRRDRQVFFSTDLTIQADNIKLTPTAKPYRMLLEDLIASETGKKYGLADIIRLDKESDKTLAPKAQGINIEGMAPGPDNSLFIGLRNPLIESKALVVQLLNPDQVATGKQSCRFGRSDLLDLAGRGIRAMEYHPENKQYYIIAGEKSAENRFSLYSWSGESSIKPRELLKLDSSEKFNPEALFFKDGYIYLLSDDGAVKVPVNSAADCLPGEYKNGTCENKSLIDDNKKTFRMQKIEIPD